MTVRVLFSLSWISAFIVSAFLCPEHPFYTFEGFQTQTHACNNTCDALPNDTNVFLKTAPCPPYWKLSLICQRDFPLNCSEIIAILDRCIETYNISCDTIVSAFDSCVCESNISCPTMNDTLWNHCPENSGVYSCQQPPTTIPTTTSTTPATTTAAAATTTTTTVTITTRLTTTGMADIRGDTSTDFNIGIQLDRTSTESVPGIIHKIEGSHDNIASTMAASSPVVNTTVPSAPASRPSVSEGRCESMCLVLVLLGTFVLSCLAITVAIVAYQKHKRSRITKMSPSSTSEVVEFKGSKVVSGRTNENPGIGLRHAPYGNRLPPVSPQGKTIGHQCSPFHVDKPFMGFAGNQLEYGQTGSDHFTQKGQSLTDLRACSPETYFVIPRPHVRHLSAMELASEYKPINWPY